MLTVEDAIQCFNDSIYFYIFENIETEAGQVVIELIASDIVNCNQKFDVINKYCKKYACCAVARMIAYSLGVLVVTINNSGGNQGDGSSFMFQNPKIDPTLYVKKDVVGRVSREYDFFESQCKNCDENFFNNLRAEIEGYINACNASLLGGNNIGGSFLPSCFSSYGCGSDGEK